MPWSLEQRAAHRRLVDAVGHAHRQQRVQLLAVGREPLEAELARARARSASWAVAWRAQRASRPSSCTIAQRLAQRVDHVDRRGVVVGAAAAGSVFQ